MDTDIDFRACTMVLSISVIFWRQKSELPSVQLSYSRIQIRF